MFTVRTRERTRKGPANTVKPLTRTCKTPTCKMWGKGFRGTGTSWPRIPQGYLWYSLILTHWMPDKQLIVETDASNYALGAILSITLDSSEVHPVAFHSCTFSAPKLNYDTHNKELVAIFEAF